jgi:phage tail sheath protein FI
MGYKHGIYGELVASSESISTTKTVPVYIGTAPIHRVKTREINKPLIIRNLEEAQLKLGYRDNDNFNMFTLSAVIFAHFANKIKPIGPIVVIVLDTTKGVSNTKEISFINGVGYIEDHALIESVEIADEVLGVDYNVKYNDSGKLQITGDKLTATVSVGYEKVDPTAITSADVIGIYDESSEKRTGIKAISDVYEELNLVPAIIAAPGYSQIKEVEQALVSSTSKITDRWEAVCYVDIDSKVATNREAAIKWKTDNNYKYNSEKVCWPKVKVGEKELWMSIVAIVRKLQTDVKNKDVPYESASNKQIDINGLVTNGQKIKFSQEKANGLNEKGITTAIYSAGKYVLWGPHMANYDYIETTKPEEIFDVNIMMNKYLLNDFQLRNIDLIDSPMTRHDIDALLVSEQMILNAYVSAGELLYGEIKFNKSDNSRSDLIQGDFAFNTLVTNTPPAKSITQKVQYSSVGIDSLYGEEDKA